MRPIRKKTREQEITSRRHVRQEQAAHAETTDTSIADNQKKARELRQWAKDHGYRKKDVDKF